jgi:hypothetical protein
MVTGYKEIFGNGNEFTRLNQFDVSGNLTINHANGNSSIFLGVDAANLGTLLNEAHAAALGLCLAVAR